MTIRINRIDACNDCLVTCKLSNNRRLTVGIEFTKYIVKEDNWFLSKKLFNYVNF